MNYSQDEKDLLKELLNSEHYQLTKKIMIEIRSAMIQRLIDTSLAEGPDQVAYKKSQIDGVDFLMRGVETRVASLIAPNKRSRVSRKK